MTGTISLTNLGGIANALFNSVSANSTAVTSMSVGGHTINATSFAGTANNANNLGGVAAASYQLNSTLAANVATLTANNSTNLNGQAASFYTNASNLSTGTLPDARLSSAVVNTSGAFTLGGNINYNANLTIASTGELIITNGAGIIANSTLGVAGQVLTTNGTSVYWSSAGVNTAAQYAWTNTHTFAANVAFDTSTLFIDATNDRVGIGTTSPAERLHVAGDIRLQQAIPEIKFVSEGNVNRWYLGANISDTVNGGFIIGSGADIGTGTERMRITADGNVGIGTSTPTARLDVRGEITNFVGTFGTQRVLQNWGWDNAVARWKPVIEADASFSLYNYDTGGGTPVRSFFSTNGTGTFTQFSNSARAPIFFDSDNTGYYANPAGDSFFQGRTRFGPVAGSVSNGNQVGLEIMNNGGTGDGNVAAMSYHCQGLYAIHQHLRADGYFGIGGWSAAAWRWYVYMVNGDMTASGNVVAYSDPRLKENITKIDNPIEKLTKLNGVRFRWKENSILGHPGEYDYGVLANEVQEVFPEIVADTMHDSPDGDKYKAVAYDKLVPVLIEAVKSQQNEIEELKGLIKSLMERI